jgi:predicted Zn finger-like uncharacterized protein
MDVRCDRCQTEYELDDESVAEGGASVQCTSCGNTFVVGRQRPPVAAPPAAQPVKPAAAGPITSSWMLTTEEGKTHRFRDSTTLQKWVVERRVGRMDRVCPPNGTWRRLGDVDELRPFFDVVDQADRAAAAARVARPTRPETPRGSAQGRSTYVSADDDDDDILTSRRPRQSAVSASFASLSPEDDLVAAGLAPRHGGRKLAVAAVVVLGILAAYLGFKGPSGFRLPWAPPAAPTAAAPSPAPAAPIAAVPPPAAPAPAHPSAATSDPPMPAAPAAAPAPAPAAAPPPVPAAAPPVAHGAAPADEPTPPAAEPSPHGGGPAAEAGHPKSYERLVADADHALENGQSAKAQKLYDEALRLQPNGVAAVTGTAYLLLDRQKPLAAIDMFNRALGMSPGFAPALFGVGEAYRLEGQPAKAVAAYKRYLEASPTGADAPAARRQMRELDGQAAGAGPSHAEASSPPPAPTVPTSPPPQP